VCLAGVALQALVTLISYKFKIYIDGKLNIYSIREIAMIGGSEALDIGLKPPGEEHFWGFFRAGGTMGGFNITAMYFGMWLPMTLAYYLIRREWWIKWGSLAIFLTGGVGLVLTFSRGGWINAAIGCAIVLGVCAYRGYVTNVVRLQILACVLLAITTVVVTPSLREKVMKRLKFVDTEVAVSPRINMMKIALMMSTANPILGIGVNNYLDRIPDFYKGDDHALKKFPVHNKYLIVAVEIGYVGLACFLAFLGAILLRGYENLRIRDPVIEPIALGLFAAVPGTMMHMNIDIFDVYSILSTLFLMAGLTASIYRLTHGYYDEATEPAPMGGPATPRPLAEPETGVPGRVPERV